MNNDEAKSILHAYRPSGADASDPQFQEALEQTRKDPQLAAWFAEQAEFDAAFQGKLREGAPRHPALKADLLAMKKIVRPRVWWRQPAWLAAAAVLAALLAVAAFWFRPPGSGPADAFIAAMIPHTEHHASHVTMMSADLGEIKEWLRTQKASGSFDLPEGLAKQRMIGCRVVEWRGRKVSLVCLKLDKTHHVDLFVTDRAALADAPAPGKPVFSRSGALTLARWTSGDRVFLLAGEAGEKRLQEVL